MFFFVVSQVLMFFISLSSLSLYLAVCIVGFVQGGCFVLVGIISHEEFGIKNFSKSLGRILTAGAVGILIYDQLVFTYLYNFLGANTTSELQSYGKWNFYIFLIAVLSSILAFFMALSNYLTNRKKDNAQDKIGQFVNF